MTLGLFFFAALHYAFLLFLLFAACALGGRCLRGGVFLNAFERFVFSVAVGLGGLGTITFLLGLAGLLHAPVMIFALLAMLASGYPELRDTLRAALAALRRARWWQAALGAGVAAAGSRLLLLPLYPPIQWDAISYHFAVAGMYARQHEVFLTPYLRSPVFPQLNEMLFSLAILLYDDLAAQLVQMLFLLLTAALLAAWARRVGGGVSAGLWAAALWISSPLMMMLGSSGYIEMSLACLLTAAAYAFAVWLETRERGWLLLAAALLGFAEGTKYLALFPILLAGLVLLYRAARARWSAGSLTDVYLFTAMTIAVSLPWHLRMGLLTGNPIWPYASGLLGSGPWPPEQIQSLLRDQFHPGAGTGLQAIAMLPWNLAFRLEPIYIGELAFTPVMFLLLPLGLLAAVWDRAVRLPLALLALYTAFWFFTAQNARYIVHALPLLCLACGLALARLAALVQWLRDSSPGRAVLAAALCVALAAPGYHLAKLPSGAGWVAMPEELPPSTPDGRTAFIAARIPEYTAIEHLNRTHPGPYTLYSFPLSNLAAYVNGTFVGDWYGPARYDEYLAQLNNPGGMYRFLRRHGVDYLLMGQMTGFGAGHSDEMLLPEIMSGHLKLIYAEDSIVYEVQDRPVRLRDAPELLANEKLEEPLVDGAPPGWSAHGAPRMDATSQQAWQSATAVGATAADWIEQTVPVESGSIYVFRVLARATHEEQYGVYQVEWLDEAGQPLATFRRIVSNPVDWAARATAATAPPGVAQARVSASTTGPNPMWFDWFSFKQISYEW